MHNKIYLVFIKLTIHTVGWLNATWCSTCTKTWLNFIRDTFSLTLTPWIISLGTNMLFCKILQDCALISTHSSVFVVNVNSSHIERTVKTEKHVDQKLFNASLKTQMDKMGISATAKISFDHLRSFPKHPVISFY